MSRPAERLVGERVNGCWTVVERLEKKVGESGGNFSTGYIVEKDDGVKGFLKAIDFLVDPNEADPARKLQELTAAFNFERDILSACRNARLRRVAIAIDDGRLVLPDTGEVVQFLIFELADGNLHHRVLFDENFELAWALRVAHNVASGLWQVHKEKIAHLDLKPSNVLYYVADGSKIADFGRSSRLGTPVFQHERLTVAGDLTYAPPELLYGYVHPEWFVRRIGCDMYLLGSLVVHLISGVGLTQQILSRLPVGYSFNEWPYGYEAIKPHISDLVDAILNDALSNAHPTIRGDLQSVLDELCNVEPEKRGKPGLGRPLAVQFSLQRYISIFDRLAKKSELFLRNK
ncbi:protein kinase [Salinisphaera sp. T31B1]|uniref:protein kinase domain-containing protein n=1 Tax=Salinisphaera sp. T31B1 TaxID=727963 RepID=UPI00333F21A2